MSSLRVRPGMQGTPKLLLYLLVNGLVEFETIVCTCDNRGLVITNVLR